MQIDRRKFIKLVLTTGIGPSLMGCRRTSAVIPEPVEPTAAPAPQTWPVEVENVATSEPQFSPYDECINWAPSGECIDWEPYDECVDWSPRGECIGWESDYMIPADECIDWDPSGECIGWGDGPVSEYYYGPVNECVRWNPRGECIGWDSPVYE